MKKVQEEIRKLFKEEFKELFSFDEKMIKGTYFYFDLNI